MRGSFDPQLIGDAATRLTDAAAGLEDLTARLGSLPHGAMPHPVDDRLGSLKSHGRDMIKDIGGQAAALAARMREVSGCYADVENSIVASFRVAE
ncbi:hypothetical protein QEZ54_06680 [Catellatospora sp. KI3]|uniref:hypothetical protein n=1 Tax=Catellatospora sp. KI3 TaxID=3041620 RepID=UPI002482D973|nr:hypothetical protein [Catellatospora sp. KI3]MDI1460643.1 hypothetical protein [Catellatospora sp. KI3]